MSVKHRERAASKDQTKSSKGISTKEGPSTSLAWRPSSKIRDRHWERLAVVYIRQSSPHQVLENRESRERQYALAKVAEQFGWPADRVLVIDEDQGLSGKFSEARDGFQRLLTEVTLDHVGLVLGLELSRLARSCKDWHHLVEVCAVFDTLLYDQDGIYDPNDSNDRLLLGMKGAMSEYELITLRNRLERGRENKAARGELFLHLPIGYVKSPTGEPVQEPDEQARGVVQLVFDKFEELGTVWRVFCYFKQNKIQFGFRCLRGPKRGQLEWRRATHNRVLAILRHPIYAGAYAYGFHRPGRKNPVSGQVEGGKWFLSPDEIRVLIQGRVPAYISWEQYLANQRRLSENRSFPGSQGAARAGRALLSGLIVCGRCGHCMNVGYHAGKRKKPHYWCDTHFFEEREQPCFGLKAPPVDELVAEQVLRALEGAGRRRVESGSGDGHPAGTRASPSALATAPGARPIRGGTRRASVSERRTGEPPGGANAGAALGGVAAAGAATPGGIRPFPDSDAGRPERYRRSPHPSSLGRHRLALARAGHDSPRSQGDRALSGGSCRRPR